MISPFPGMDPYLEDIGLWPDVHHGLISEMQAVLNRRLRPKYHVRVEERVYISDENVHVSRQGRRPKGRVWPILLTQRLPDIPVPLRPEDQDAALDLQQVLATTYDRAAYDLEVDYGQEPAPPLPAKYAKWADELLRSKGLR